MAALSKEHPPGHGFPHGVSLVEMSPNVDDMPIAWLLAGALVPHIRIDS